jgi:hypothetical protein
MSYFTVIDLIIAISMALAGAQILEPLPCKSSLKCNSLRVLGALLGVAFTMGLIEGLPAFVTFWL